MKSLISEAVTFWDEKRKEGPLRGRSISIAGREIGLGLKPFVIAEVSGNHNGSLERALEIMEAAKQAGADAIKLQTYTPDTLTISCDGDDFRIKEGLWKGMTLYELYEQAHTPWEWHEQLFEKGRELGIPVFSTPFDETAVDFIEQFDPPAYKIASFEIVDLELIRKVASTGKPVILSTGMASRNEIDEAVAAVTDAGCKELALLYCVSGYPTPIDEANLANLSQLAQRYRTVVGLSDHTHGIVAAIVSVAYGACLIEKHFTLNRADGGPDADFSLEPQEMAELCRQTELAWKSVGVMSEARKPSEEKMALFRRSLYVVKDVDASEPFTRENVRCIRPGFGILPKHFPEILGRRAKRALKRGTPLRWDAIEGGDAS